MARVNVRKNSLTRVPVWRGGQTCMSFRPAPLSGRTDTWPMSNGGLPPLLTAHTCLPWLEICRVLYQGSWADVTGVPE